MDNMLNPHSRRVLMSLEVNVRDEFLKPLPHVHLYKHESDEKSYRQVPKDWYSFLSNSDDNSGRAESRSSGGIRHEFHYIQYDRVDFLKLIKKVIKPRHRSFIDVGCGAGDKLDIVKSLRPDMHVVGVEHDPAMATWARLVADEVFCQDALTLDFAPFDVIYAYWPVCNGDLMMKLCRRIIKTKRRSSKFILVGFRASRQADNEFLARHTISGVCL